MPSPHDGPARRGRRNPEIQQAMQDEGPDMEVDLQLDAEGDQRPEEDVMVLPGDVIAMKVTHSVTFDGQESWITYGLQTRVMPEESEEDAFQRVATVVNTRVLDAADDAYERVQSMQNRQLQPRGRR